jgi:hexokinase
LCVTESDLVTMQVLVRCLLERAAKLVVLVLAGPMEAENMGVTAPALIVAEGSTFWKNRTLHQMIEAQANLFLKDHLGRSFVFFGGEQLNLYGAAAAAFRT